jgi:hypothetical protein
MEEDDSEMDLLFIFVREMIEGEMTRGAGARARLMTTHTRMSAGEGGSMVAHAQKLASWSMPNWESFGVKVSRKGCLKWWCT